MTNCVAKPCPIILNSTCVFYTGANLLYSGIVTNDNLQTALEKINLKFKDASIGYIFQDGVTQVTPGDPVTLGGIFTQDVTISNGPYNFLVTNNLEAGAHVTTGGSSLDFVKGDGSLDNTPYQPSGNYITNLTGDGFASGPGVATFTLDNVNPTTGVFGSATRVPVITTNSKGLITNITTTLITAVSGTGTQNYLPKWGSSPSTLDSSIIYDDGSGVMINTTTYDYYKLDVNGSARVMTNLVVGPVYPGSILIDTAYGIRVNTPMSGAVNTFGVFADGEVQSDSTGAVYYFRSFAKTKATSFTVGDLHHFMVTQGTFGAGSTVTNQYGFRVFSNMIGATNTNRGFFGELPADGTKNWNLWMSGTAPNHMAGGLQIGPNALGNQSLRIGRAISAATYVVTSDGAISSGAAAGVTNYVSGLRTTGTFTLSSFTHYLAVEQVTPTTVTSQVCFWANNTIISGTNNFGFRGSLPSNTNNWNLYMDGSAKNHLSGTTLIGTTSDDAVNKLQVNGNIKASQYRLSALNAAPTSATDTGTLGEIRIDANYIYVCVATNTWKRSAISTW